MSQDRNITASAFDEFLVADLRRILGEIDGVPEPARIAARAALDWRTLDAEFAALVHDSRIDEPAHAVRGACEARALTFELEDLTIEVEGEPSADEGLTLAGQLVPAQGAEVIVRNRDELFATRADERGQFVMRGIVSGPLSLRCRLDGPAGDGRLVETAWLSI